MKEVVFWDVDTQYDFIMPDGRLQVPGAVEILPHLARLTQLARRNRSRIQVVASMDDHQLTDEEISEQPDFTRTFPPHCMRGSIGQMKVISTEPLNGWVVPHQELSAAELDQKLRSHQGEIVILKKALDVFSNPNTERIVHHLDPREIYVYGVALDYCDACAVEGFLRLHRRNLYLVLDATEAIDRRRGRELVEDWTHRGVKVLSTDQVCASFGGPA